MKIPAITLWEPWASLIACGAKKIETRSRKYNYTGPIAIHAGKKTVWDLEYRTGQMIRGALFNHLGPEYASIMAKRAGHVLCIARMDGCRKILDSSESLPHYAERDFAHPPPEPERSFGNYEPGRYGWVLDKLIVLPKPIPAKGGQFIWSWEVPPDLEDQVQLLM